MNQLEAVESSQSASDGGNAQVHLARSVVLVNTAAYFILVYADKDDADKLFQIYRRVNKTYLKTKAIASKRKKFVCKTEKCPILDMAIVSAVASQGATVELLKRAWQDLKK